MISVNCVQIIIILFPIGATLTGDSVLYLNALTAASHKWKRQARACQPLKIKVGSMSVLRRITVFKMLHLVVFYTMRYMLVFSKK